LSWLTWQVTFWPTKTVRSSMVDVTRLAGMKARWLATRAPPAPVDARDLASRPVDPAFPSRPLHRAGLEQMNSDWGSAVDDDLILADLRQVLLGPLSARHHSSLGPNR
jgi:hypothetical protein